MPLDVPADLILSEEDEHCIAVHRLAGMKALEHSSGMYSTFEHELRGAGDQEAAAQAYEAAEEYEQQAADEFERADARLRRAIQEQAVPAIDA